MSKITNDGLTRSGTGCFIAVPIWQQWASKGLVPLQVLYNGQASKVQQLSFGVPQGSVLGPLLYVLYTAKLSRVITQHGLRFHQYADDSQIYISTTVGEEALAVQRFTACVKAINDWMSSSRLKLNPTKTEVLWLGFSQQLSQISITDIPLQSTTIRVGEFARDLVVIIE